MRATHPRDGLIRLIRNHIRIARKTQFEIEIRSTLFRVTFFFRRSASPILRTAWSPRIAVTDGNLKINRSVITNQLPAC